MAQFQDADVVAAELEKVRPAVPVLFERDDTFYSEVPVRTDVEVISKAMAPSEVSTSSGCAK